VIFSLQLSDRAGDGVGELPEPVAFAVQPPLVLTQRRDLVTITGEDLGDRAESQTELARQENLLQSQELLLLVVAVAIAADVRRPQQTDVVVVPQRPRRHLRHPGHLGDRPRHASLRAPSRLGAGHHRR